MYLHSVSIIGFRIFESFSVVLDRNLNIIVGENNSGKTALIDAIRYALSTNSLDWIRVQESDFRSGHTKFSIQLKFDDVTARQAAVFAEHLTHELLADGRSRKSVLYVIASGSYAMPASLAEFSYPPEGNELGISDIQIAWTKALHSNGPRHLRVCFKPKRKAATRFGMIPAIVEWDSWVCGIVISLQDG